MKLVPVPSFVKCRSFSLYSERSLSLAAENAEVNIVKKNSKINESKNINISHRCAGTSILVLSCTIIFFYYKDSSVSTSVPLR